MNITEIIARKGEPFGNLTAFPITMRHYEELQENKICLTLMQKRVQKETGINVLSMPYLRMICLITSKELNLLAMLSKVLSLVFHINEEQIRIHIARDSRKVSLVIVDDGDNPQPIETISELRFNKLRELIASQNNIKLPDERANLEILESEEELARQNHADLNVDFKSLFFSVATYCGLSTEAMLDMTVFEFEERVSAISRITRYTMCGQGEFSGMVSFKSGNPYPSWCFDRKDDGLHGMIPLGQFQQKMSTVAQQK